MFTPKLPIKFDANFSVKKTHVMQLRLSKQVIREDMLPKTIRYVAGVDTAYRADMSVGAAVVLNYETLTVVESRKARVKTRFPYISTLLSFREIPPTLAAIKKLKTQPDVFLVDGQGIAHPYRLGFASHLGLILNKPAIGVAKSLLCGKIGSFNQEGWAPIIDKAEVIGVAVARKRGKPIYVSVGHMVSLKKAIAIVKHCTGLHRIPEPTRAAHIIANEGSQRQRKKVAPNIF
jgi:deoxyribonuclease V